MAFPFNTFSFFLSFRLPLDEFFIIRLERFLAFFLSFFLPVVASFFHRLVLFFKISYCTAAISIGEFVHFSFPNSSPLNLLQHALFSAFLPFRFLFSSLRPLRSPNSPLPTVRRLPLPHFLSTSSNTRLPILDTRDTIDLYMFSRSDLVFTSETNKFGTRQNK